MWNWLERICSRKTREQELDREIRGHLELEAEEQTEAGLPPQEARYAARRAFGNVMLIREVTREMWGWTSLERFAQDLRYAVRTLGHSPAFSIVAVLSLALGIGANTAIFSLVDGLWFRPMPIGGAGELTRLFSVTSQDAHGYFSFPEYLELQKQAPAFRRLVAIGRRGARMPNPDGTFDLLLVNVVSTNFFQALRVRAAVGRTFLPSDEPTQLQQPVVLLGYSFWQRRYGGDPAIVGKQIQLDRGDGSALITVLGVLPREFREIEPSLTRDLWFPPQTWIRLSGRGDFEERNFRWFELLGRIAPGASVASARAQAQTIAQRLAAAWPATNAGRGANVVPDLRYRLEQAGTNGLMLLAVVLLVVLLCSVNVANLLLARSAARSREFAVRLALGAGRLRLLRQLMTENSILGLAGLAAGLVIGVWLIGILPALLPGGFRSELMFVFDSRVFLFSLAVSVVTIAFFGLTPSWRASSQNLMPALKGETSLGGASRRGFHLRHWLVIAQVSVSLTLLAVTGVLVESFVNTRILDFGLSRKPLLTIFLSWPGDQAPVMYREALARITALPGVKEVAYATRAPLSLSEGGMVQRVSFPGRTEWQRQPPVEIKYNSISSNYLRVMGTPLIRGRAFDELDQSSGPRVALISERMAQRYWPGEDPLGKTIRLEGPQGPECRIVGIVKNVPINEIGEPPEPYLYLPTGETSPSHSPSRSKPEVMRSASRSRSGAP